jgi:hypothetical protein
MKTTVISLALFTAFAGCAAPEEETAEMSAPPVSGELSYTVRTPERLAGSYERNGVTLHFDSQKLAGDSQLQLRRADGVEIMNVRRGGAGGTMNLFGTAVAMGNMSSSAVQPVAGQSAAFEALAQSQEFGLIGHLAVEMENSGVKAPNFPAVDLIGVLGKEFRPLLESTDGTVRQALEGPGNRRGGFECIQYLCTNDEMWDPDQCACVNPAERQPDPDTVAPPRTLYSYAYKKDFELVDGVWLDHTYFCLDGTDRCHTIRGWGVGSDQTGGEVVYDTRYVKTNKQMCLAESRASNNPLTPCGLLSELYGINGVCHQHTNRGQLSMHGKFINPDELLGGKWSFIAYGAYGINHLVCWAQSNIACVLQ